MCRKETTVKEQDHLIKEHQGLDGDDKVREQFPADGYPAVFSGRGQGLGLL